MFTGLGPHLMISAPIPPLKIPLPIAKMLKEPGLYMVKMFPGASAPILVRGGEAYSINVNTMEIDSRLSKDGWSSSIQFADIQKISTGEKP